MHYIKINTWNQGQDPNPSYRYWESIGVGDNQKIDTITVAFSSDRLFTVVFNFANATGGPLLPGDIDNMTLTASIGDQDSFPRTEVKFNDIAPIGPRFTQQFDEIDRLNDELLVGGQIDDLTLVVSYEKEIAEGEFETILWNITAWDQDIELEVVPEA